MTDQETTVEEVEVLKTLSKVQGFVIYSFESKEVADSTLATLTEESMLEAAFKPCGDYDQIKRGTASFDGEDNNFLLSAANSTLMQITIQEKRPHGATVKKQCKAAEAKYKLDNGVEVVDKETKLLIKDTIVQGLLPSTTPEDPKTTLLWFYGKYLIVGIPSYNKAEDYISTVRFISGSCPVEPVKVQEDVVDKLTDMLKTRYQDKMELLNLVHLSNENSKGLVKFEKESLYQVEYKTHLEDGCTVDKMQVTYDYVVDYTLNKDFEFSGIKIDKDVLNGSKDIGALIVTVGFVNQAIDEVIKVFGGEVEE